MMLSSCCEETDRPEQQQPQMQIPLQCDVQDCFGVAISAPAVQISMASIVTLNSGLSEWRELKLQNIDIFEATRQVTAAKLSAAC